MNERLRAKLEKMISRFVAVRYVYIKDDDAFFVFKNIFRDFDVEESAATATALDFCAIYHNNKIFEGMEKTAPYISQYKDNIEASPEFLIDSILEANKEEVTSESPRYLTPIKDLLKEIGLLRDGRAGRQPVDPIIIKRNDFLAAYYKKLGSPKRIPMQDIQDALRKKLGEWFPENAKMVDKHLLSDDQIRRIVKSRI